MKPKLPFISSDKGWREYLGISFAKKVVKRPDLLDTTLARRGEFVSFVWMVI